MNLTDAFLRAAQRHPKRPALIDGAGQRTSYGALASLTAGLAGTFAGQGIEAGDRVLVALKPGAELYAGLAALWHLGAVAVFPEPAMGLAGLRHAALTTQPKALLADPWLRVLALAFPETRAIPLGLSPAPERQRREPPPATDAKRPAVISFTSDSSGPPRAMARSHALLMAQHRALTPLLAGNGQEVDVVAFPAFVLPCLGHGHTAVLPGWPLKHPHRADPTALRQQAQMVGATRLLLPPAVTARLAGQPLPDSVRRVLSCGAPLYPDIARRFLAGAPGVGLTVVYGSPEADPIAHLALETLAEDAWTRAAGGGGLPVGRPVPDIRLRLIDGEITVCGNHVNPGYLDPTRDAETKLRQGNTIWHRTGDMGRIDPLGRLWLLGRKDDSRDGLAPLAVEAAARLWPGVTNAALLADPDQRPKLALSGDAHHLKTWHSNAQRLGDLEVHHLPTIPMDKHHPPKPDLPTLRKLLP
ncbi:AMP-binding protein [Roseospirillum parvum]|uniref:Acyl-CoA synthetase (AMP-forming)/AMP-acid ligase II n=1 Tax=Roseospirillum parvum TaxID=83401 RepID=A0A1G8CV04_9PROT|nr:AMP-binding protein [Roseospirillum parvum]SDH48770.1 Acyl-CoA synthetase (AMP-forming)/AMP-acid ligase II [Roseospirillum parvum]